MKKRNPSPDPMHTLDHHAANGLLNSVYAACDLSPSTVPVEVLEGWSNYKKSKFRIVRMITYVILVILILLPVMFFQPAVSVERTDVDYTASASYQVEVKSFLPTRDISAEINGNSIPMSRSETGGYLLQVSENGTLTVEVTSANGQIVSKEYEVAYIDTEKPALVRSYSEDGIVYLVLRDPYSGIDYEGITAVGSDGKEIETESADEKEGIISYKIPKDPITVSIPDKAGNVLSLLVSPVES